MKGITIAICDDDKMALTVIAGAVRSAFEENGVTPEILTYSSAEKLRDDLDTTAAQLIMTDIDMPQLDGIQLGMHLRRLGKKVDIIFVSNCESRVFESLAVHPFGFVRKSNFLKDMSDVISRYIEAKNIEGTTQTIDLPTRYSGRIHVPVADILYFEGNGMYQFLRRRDGRQEEITSRMDHLEKALQEHGFMRIHKGYLVNYRYIMRLDKEEATLTDGQKIPISRRRAKEIKEQYLQLGRNQGVLLF